MHTITLEEHYVTSDYFDGPGRMAKERMQRTFPGERTASGMPPAVEQLYDLDARRIADMDAAGIDVQALLLMSPGFELSSPDEALRLAHETNDELAQAVQRHPDRFIGFAALPTPAPEAAADELERTVRDYGFKGAIINGHIGGRYIDDSFFWPILERAEALQVPIYLHPAVPPPAVIQASYTGNFSPDVTTALASAGWGWHIETAVHILRIILSGAFDRYPDLQFIIGHMGEALPFMLQRFDYTMPSQLTHLQRPLSAYLRQNLNYTFSGFNFLPLFNLLRDQVGIDRILFSADYPLRPMPEARRFLDQLPVSDAEREQIAHGNAERLLRL